MRTLQLAGQTVPVIGQGTWRMGEDASQRAQEVRALQQGLEHGLNLIDTAEMYGEGGAEEIVGQAIRGQRDKVFLVSKVYPHNASRQGVRDACERSLRRLGSEHIDLYLLHWPGSEPLEETVAGFESLVADGKIARWGVSNFDVADMQELADARCATNQVLYNPQARGIEFDLLPWAHAADLPIMAYCPIAQGGSVLQHPALQQVAQRHRITSAQACLAWVLRHPGMIAIPKASSSAHIAENAAAADLHLDAEDFALLDAAFAPPKRKQRLSMV
jgi:diketogulonate reductase-like aldo/keto reductase